MNTLTENKYLILIVLSIFASCRTQQKLTYDSKLFADSTTQYYIVPQRFSGIKNTLQTSIKFHNDKYLSFSVNIYGIPFSINSTNKLNSPTSGISIGFYKSKTKCRIRTLKFVDSNSLVNGPVFVFKRNGKLKHIYRFKNDHFDSLIYTASRRTCFKDTGEHPNKIDYSRLW